MLVILWAVDGAADRFAPSPSTALPPVGPDSAPGRVAAAAARAGATTLLTVASDPDRFREEPETERAGTPAVATPVDGGPAGRRPGPAPEPRGHARPPTAEPTPITDAPSRTRHTDARTGHSVARTRHPATRTRRSAASGSHEHAAHGVRDRARTGAGDDTDVAQCGGSTPRSRETTCGGEKP